MQTHADIERLIPRGSADDLRAGLRTRCPDVDCADIYARSAASATTYSSSRVRVSASPLCRRRIRG